MLSGKRKNISDSSYTKSICYQKLTLGSNGQKFDTALLNCNMLSHTVSNARKLSQIVNFMVAASVKAIH